MTVQEFALEADEDPGWPELVAALRDHPDVVLRRMVSSRGTADTIIVALGSAGAFTTMIEIVKMWIGKRPQRSLKITRVDGGQTAEIDLKNASEDELKAILKYFPERP